MINTLPNQLEQVHTLSRRQVFHLRACPSKSSDLNLLSENEKSTIYNISQDSVAIDTSLKDALAIMLKLGRRVLPVLNEGSIVGEIYLKDIEEIFGKVNE